VYSKFRWTFPQSKSSFTAVLGMKTRNRGNAFINFVHPEDVQKRL
jgi:hypothetical protein